MPGSGLFMPSEQAVMSNTATAHHLPRQSLSLLVRYGLALASVGICASAWFALARLFNSTALLLVFVPAVLVSSALGGLLPGLLATALSLAIYVSFEHSAGYEPVRLVIFAVVGCGIAYWGEQLYRNRQDTARITEELLATTEDLRAREAHVNSILQTVPDAMIVISEQGVIQSFSTAAQRLFGYSADEVIGSNVRRLMPNPDRDQHDGYLGRYLRTGKSGSSASAGWWSPSARMARRSRSNLRSAR